MAGSGNAGCSFATERVEHKVIDVRAGQQRPLDQGDWQLGFALTSFGERAAESADVGPRVPGRAAGSIGPCGRRSPAVFRLFTRKIAVSVCQKLLLILQC